MGEICNDMCIWKQPNQRCYIFVPFIIGKGNDSDIIGVIRSN
jgi:hypothetical protein